jgi:hypothetical protein
MPLIRLRCFSYTAGAVGKPGDVVECDQKTADYFFKYRAADPVNPPAAKAPTKPKPEPAEQPEPEEQQPPPPPPVRGNPKRARS